MMIIIEEDLHYDQQWFDLMMKYLALLSKLLNQQTNKQNTRDVTAAATARAIS